MDEMCAHLFLHLFTAFLMKTLSHAWDIVPLTFVGVRQLALPLHLFLSTWCTGTNRYMGEHCILWAPS